MVLSERPQSLKQLPRLAFPRGTIADRVDGRQSSLTLDSDQRHYLVRVRRLKVGQSFLAFDSSGRLWQATLTDDGAAIEAELSPVVREFPFELELAIAVPKGSGFDSLVRQLTELGVSRIVPLTSERTVSAPSSKKHQRWQTIAIEAAEQCERVVVPTVARPIAWQDWLGHREPSTQKQGYIAAARANCPHLLTYLTGMKSEHWPSVRQVSIAVGPEGGWTDAELALAEAAGMQPARLGNRILRTVTAPLAIASMVAGFWDCQISEL